MLDAILKGNYSTQDVAYALQHNKFTNHQRDVTRTGTSILPRKSVPGPGGGEYRYAHVLEHALLMTIGRMRGRDVCRSVYFGLLRLLQGNDYGCKKLNAMSAADRRVVASGGTEFEDDDFPTGAPHDIVPLVDFPTIYFNSDFISRDPANPHFLIYDNAPISDAPALVDLVNDMSLAEAQALLIERKLERAGSQTMADIYREQFDDIPVLNLTSMLIRIDERLQLRLKAREMRGA